MKKSLALTLAILMVIGIAIGGTIAWLTDTSEEVKNTFTTSDVDINLNETDDDKNFQMIPGCTIEKDPTVTVDADSEDCYVFVQITEDLNAWEDYDGDFKDFLTYGIAEGWSELKDDEENVVAGVYYRQVAKADTDRTFSVLAGNKVTVSGDVTKAMMDALKVETDYPTLTFKAYACQYMKNNNEHFEAAEAWGKINPPAGE